MEESDGQLRLPVRLQPLDENSGSVELLRNEIERLQKDNFKLETKLSEVAEQVSETRTYVKCNCSIRRNLFAPEVSRGYKLFHIRGEIISESH